MRLIEERRDGRSLEVSLEAPVAFQSVERSGS